MLPKSEKAQNELFHFGSTANRLSDQYNVSHNTIKRDFKLAGTISRIGEISPEAKKKILNGEVGVNKAKLEALSSAPREEIEAVATMIAEGTYARRPRHHAAQPGPEAILPEIRKLNEVIKGFASNFSSMVQKMSTGSTEELKPVLRSYIDQLEDLYRGMS
jgi:hypothetical protein